MIDAYEVTEVSVIYEGPFLGFVKKQCPVLQKERILYF